MNFKNTNWEQSKKDDVISQNIGYEHGRALELIKRKNFKKWLLIKLAYNDIADKQESEEFIKKAIADFNTIQCYKVKVTRAKSREVKKLDYTDKDLVKEYLTVKDVEEDGFKVQSVRNCLKGKKNYHTYKGYLWKWKHD